MTEQLTICYGGGMTSRSGKALRLLALLVALVVAYFAGVLTERVRFDAQRQDVIQKYDKALKAWRDQQMQAEKATGKPVSR